MKLSKGQVLGLYGRKAIIVLSIRMYYLTSVYKDAPLNKRMREIAWANVVIAIPPAVLSVPL